MHDLRSGVVGPGPRSGLAGHAHLTPDGTCEAVTSPLLSAGVNTFLEGPLAITAQGRGRILGAAGRPGARRPAAERAGAAS